MHKFSHYFLMSFTKIFIIQFCFDTEFNRETSSEFFVTSKVLQTAENKITHTTIKKTCLS